VAEDSILLECDVSAGHQILMLGGSMVSSSSGVSKIQRFAQKHKGRLHHHENIEAIQLLDNTCIVRRLQRKKPFELV